MISDSCRTLRLLLCLIRDCCTDAPAPAPEDMDACVKPGKSVKPSKKQVCNPCSMLLTFHNRWMQMVTAFIYTCMCDFVYKCFWAVHRNI